MYVRLKGFIRVVVGAMLEGREARGVECLRWQSSPTNHPTMTENNSGCDR